MSALPVDTYLTRWFNAGMAKNDLSFAITDMLIKGFVIYASHTIRDEKGDDVLVVIFEKVENARNAGRFK